MAQLTDTATPTPARIEPPAAEPLPDDETAAIAAFSLVAAAHADHYATLEINPLIVSPSGAVGVDLLIEPHGSSSEDCQRHHCRQRKGRVAGKSGVHHSRNGR